MVSVEKEELPRSIEIILTLWREAKKKAKGVAAPSTNNSTYASQSAKKGDCTANDK